MPTDASAIFLDLDGTLIDSQPGILSSCRAALRALGHVPGPMNDLSEVIGPPMDDVMRFLLAPYDDDRVAEAVAAYRLNYGETGLFESVAYPGIANALEEMKQHGVQLYLATSKRSAFAKRILKHLDLAPLFDGVYGSEPGGALDHKPELLAHIVSQHALTPNSCVMVGDRRYDISGAHANRMRALGVLWGYGSREELEAAGADKLVAKPECLPEAALALVTAHSE